MLDARVGRALLPGKTKFDRQPAIDELAFTLVPVIACFPVKLELNLRLVGALALAAVEAWRPYQLINFALHLEVVEEVAVTSNGSLLDIVDLHKTISTL